MTALFVLGGVSYAAGVVGSVLPVIPGPPLVYLALVCAAFARGWRLIGVPFMITMAIIAAAVTVTDFVIPNVVTRQRGATRAATTGSLAGMLVGMVLLPPVGLVVGAFAGAVIGELAMGNDPKHALRAGWGVFLGSFLSMTLKLSYAGIAGYFFLRSVLNG